MSHPTQDHNQKSRRKRSDHKLYFCRIRYLVDIKNFLIVTLIWKVLCLNCKKKKIFIIQVRRSNQFFFFLIPHQFSKSPVKFLNCPENCPVKKDTTWEWFFWTVNCFLNKRRLYFSFLFTKKWSYPTTRHDKN